MASKKTTEIVAEIVELLTPIDSAERIRAIQASMTLLGEAFSADTRRVSAVGSGAGQDSEGDLSALPPRARAWMKQNEVSLDELQQVFHLENGSADFIAGDVPGKNGREKTKNAYVLTGVSRLLSTGSPAFDDKAARALCESLGCYDLANHSTHLKHKGNEFTGTKEKGWTLTAPGLKAGAALLKETVRS